MLPAYACNSETRKENPEETGLKLRSKLPLRNRSERYGEKNAIFLFKFQNMCLNSVHALC